MEELSKVYIGELEVVREGREMTTAVGGDERGEKGGGRQEKAGWRGKERKIRLENQHQKSLFN